MQVENPFELILNKLEQIERTLIVSVNSLRQKAATEQSDPDRIINIPEAAKLLRKPVGTVRSYIHSRKLPATLVGKSYLIKYRDLMEWFDSFKKANQVSSSGVASDKMIENRKRYRKK